MAIEMVHNFFRRLEMKIFSWVLINRYNSNIRKLDEVILKTRGLASEQSIERV